MEGEPPSTAVRREPPLRFLSPGEEGAQGGAATAHRREKRLRCAANAGKMDDV